MNGIIIVDKERGMTSHDVVDIIRRRFHLKKVGHAGTLDPIATGVLVVLIGSYTKRSNELMSEDKEYEGSLILGASSDTCDAWGEITPSGESIAFSGSEVRTAFDKFSGDIEQAPPMYSSVRHNGQKLYELARKGLVVTVEPRKVSIKSIEITKIALPEVFFRLICSKGTYVRQLSADIGKALGCGAYMASLCRTRSGRFTIAGSTGVDVLRKMKKDDLEKVLITL